MTVWTKKGLLGVLGYDDLEPAGVVPLGHVVLLLPVLVLGHRLEAAQLALVRVAGHLGPDSVALRVEKFIRQNVWRPQCFVSF